MKLYVLIRDFRKDKITLHKRESDRHEDIWVSVENEMANSECQAWILTPEQLKELHELIASKVKKEKANESTDL